MAADIATGAAIEVDGLTKRYGALVAVDAARFEVPRGSVFGFLGPNGSGKTTTLGMLTGLIRPDAGTARVLGRDVREDLPGVLAEVGALIEEPAHDAHLTGARNLALLARLRGLPDPDAAASAALATVGLSEAADRKYRTYSLGIRRRLGLAAALLGDPPVLLLDEPTNGLDPAGQRDVRALLRRIAEGGRTVLVSSHILPEVQEVCTHVAIIHKGRIVETGTMDDVLRPEEVLLVDVDAPDHAVEVVRVVPGVRSVSAQGRVLRVVAPAALAPRINRELVLAGIGVTRLAPGAPALEQRFLELTGEARA